MKYLHRFWRIHGNSLRAAAPAVFALCALTSKADAQITTLLDLENPAAQGYTLYTYSFQAQLTQTFLTFEFRQDPAYWRLDDVSVTNISSTQLIVNGGFEGGTFGAQSTPNSWTLIGQAGLSAGGRASAGCAHSGSVCYKDGAVGGVDGLYQSFATTVGATYSLSFWLEADGGSTASAIVQVGASLDHGGVLVPQPTSTNIIATGSPYLAAGLGTALNPVFDGGTLQLDSSGPVFSQNFTVNSTNGTIDAAGRNSTMSGVISGAGGLTFTNSSSGGGVTLTNTNTYQGATTVNGGATLALSGTGSIAASSGVADNGIFDISASTAGASIRSLSGGGSVALGNQYLTLSNASGTFSGAIGGPGGLAITGGTETLTGTSTYTGGTAVSSGGVLIVGADAALGDAAGMLTLNEGTLRTTASFAMTRNSALAGDGMFMTDSGTNLLDNGGVTGLGGLIKSGAGTLQLCGSVSNAGGTSVTAGSLVICGSDTGTGSVTVQGGAALAITGAGTLAVAAGIIDNGSFDISGSASGASVQSLSGSGSVALGNQILTLTNASGTFTGNIAGAGGLALSGGTETLAGVNAFTGATGISGGATLALSGAGGIGSSSSVNDNGAFDISATPGASIRSLSGNGTVALGSQTLTLTGANGLFAGSIAGTGALVVTAGTETLGGVNTFTGSTDIGSGASLALSGNGSVAASSGVAANGILDISGTTAGAAIRSLSGSGAVALGNQSLIMTNAAGTFAGTVGGTGGITISGGAETLSGVNAYTGATAISSGAALALVGVGGIAGSAGVIDNGALDISGAMSGASIRSLSGNGTVALGGESLTLTGANGLFGGSIAGSGGLAIAGGSETLSGTNTYSGGTSVSGGARLIIAADVALGDASAPLSLMNGTLQTTTSFSMARDIVLAGDGALDTNGGTDLRENGNLSGVGALIKNGLGALELCGNASNTGGISVNAGSLAICGSSLGTGAIVIGTGATLALTGAGSIARSSGVTDNGTIDISGSTAGATIQSLAGNGSIALGVQTLTLANASGTFSGAIGGGGGLVLTGGTETLTGVSTYTGGTLVSNGRLIINGDAALGGASGGLTLSNATLENVGTVDTARTITLIGNNALSTDSGAVFTQSGQISGSGQLTKVGDGTLILAADNRAWGQQGSNTSGGLTIDSGLVEVENPYGLGFGLITVNGGVISTTVNILTGQTILISGATALNVDAGTTTTLTGTVETTGTSSCFAKTGGGTLVMSGTVNLANGTCVEQGQLSANGSINSIVTVSAGATLRGIGTVAGAVMVQGTLAPGNSPGTLTVAGAVTMEPGSSYQEDINGTATGAGPGNYSRLLVTGAANQFIAGGAILNVNLLNITGTAAYTAFQPALGDSFRIVTADGGIIGRFAAFTEPDGLAANTQLAIFYDPFGDKSIDLRVVPISYASFVQTAGASANARSLGTAMDQILSVDQSGRASTSQDQLLFTIAGISADALPGVLTGLAGEVHADLAAVAPQAGQWLESSVARQLEFSSADGELSAPLPGQAFWFDSTANHGRWDADDRSSGFTTNRTQVAVGFDLLAGRGSRVGIGYSHSLIDVSTPVASGSIDENLGFVYGQYSAGAVILDGLAGAGSSRWETDRVDPLGLSTATLDSSRHGVTELASFGVRLPSQLGGVDVEPYVRALWQRVARTSFNEGAALDALSGPDYSAKGVRSSAGLLVGPKNASPLAAPFGYQIDVGGGYDSGNLVHPNVAAAIAGTSTTILAPDIGRAFGRVSLTGTARLGTRTYAYAGLVDEARNGKAEDAGFNLGVRANF
jgi:fibronectin-binding autotransporter adhesin